MKPAIEIRNVNKRYGDKHAVRDLDLVVPEGCICGFLGPNGAGKSSTIRMIMSIIFPDSGSIEVLGGDALSRKDEIGYLPEERGVYPRMKVGSFLTYMARLKGAPDGDIQGKVRDWLSRMELPGVEGKKCEELSKGMQQKVQLIASLIHEPRLLILDEPFSGLDPMNALLLSRIIRELRDDGVTIVYSTHILPHAEEICDRFFLIHDGVKLLDATLPEINERFDPRTVVVELDGSEIGLESVVGVSSVARVDNAWELTVDSSVEPRAVIREVVSRFDVRSIRIRRLSLNEVFLRLVRDASGAEAVSEVREELK